MDSDEVEGILYSSVCEVVDSYIDAIKLHDDLKKAFSMRYIVQPHIVEEESEEIECVLNTVSVLTQITPEDIADEQKKDSLLRIVCPYITAREKLKSSAITKIK